MTGHLIEGILGLWRSVAAFAGERRRRIASVREVDALDPIERDRVLGEAGLTRRDFGDVMRTPFASEDLLSRTMPVIGIDQAVFRSRHGAWHRDMQRLCMACHARSRCRRDLATGDFARRHRHYCPNAGSLAAIAGAASEALSAHPAGRA